MHKKLNRVERINVSLYPAQVDILQDFAEYSGLGTCSAALRMILNEWAREHPRNKDGHGQPQKQESAA